MCHNQDRACQQGCIYAGNFTPDILATQWGVYSMRQLCAGRWPCKGSADDIRAMVGKMSAKEIFARYYHFMKPGLAVKAEMEMLQKSLLTLGVFDPGGSLVAIATATGTTPTKMSELAFFVAKAHEHRGLCRWLATRICHYMMEDTNQVRQLLTQVGSEHPAMQRVAGTMHPDVRRRRNSEEPSWFDYSVPVPWKTRSLNNILTDLATAYARLSHSLLFSGFARFLV